MFRISLCDDDPLQLEVIKVQLEKYNSLRPGINLTYQCFNTAEKVLESADDNHNFDVYLIDILLPGISGIELAKKLRDRGVTAHLVFLTSSTDYALDAFKLNATQYLVKPVNAVNLYPVLDTILTFKRHESERFFTVKTPNGRVNVLHSSIACVESIARTIKVHLSSGETLNSYTFRTSFTQVIEPLLSDKRFLHVHKSYVINMGLVESLNANTFIMRGGAEVSVPRYKLAEVKSLYTDYIANIKN